MLVVFNFSYNLVKLYNRPVKGLLTGLILGCELLVKLQLNAILNTHDAILHTEDSELRLMIVISSLFQQLVFSYRSCTRLLYAFL